MISMTKTAIALLAVAACAADPSAPDPHEMLPNAACLAWSAVTSPDAYTGTCEAACAAPPVTSGTCQSSIGECQSFEWNGVAGCCRPERVAGPVYFYECDAQ